MNPSIPLLMYHSLDDSGSPISLAPARFAHQMAWLHARGYRALPLGAVVDLLRRGAPLPPRTVVLTFDDGFRNLYEAAFPLLARYGFAATIFLVADFCGATNGWPGQPAIIPRLPLLDWPQIREMARHGIEFGAHTATHPRLDRLPPAEAEREIVGAKARLEMALGAPITLFAYPYGWSDPPSAALVRRTYRGACTTRLGLVGTASDPLALDRIEVRTLAHPRLFALLATPLLRPYLAALRPLRRAVARLQNQGWRA